MIHLYKNESRITNNTFLGNISTGPMVKRAPWRSMFVRTYTNNAAVTIYNNILWGNAAAASGDNGSDLYISNGTAFGISLYNNDFSNVKVVQENNLLQGGNINQNPQLDPDYQLGPGSPCIDGGSNTAPGLPAVDLAGDPRIQDGNNDSTAIVDMGAYELGQTGTLQVTINPQGAVDAGAKWRVPEVLAYQWVYTERLRGSAYRSVQRYSGLTKPNDQTVTISQERRRPSARPMGRNRSFAGNDQSSGSDRCRAKWRVDEERGVTVETRRLFRRVSIR